MAEIVEPQDTDEPVIQPTTPPEEPTAMPPATGDKQDMGLFWEAWEIVKASSMGICRTRTR